MAAANSDRECIIFGARRQTYQQTHDRANRLARSLHGWGLGAYRERTDLDGHQSGQHHMAVYLTNCNEFLEGMLGAYMARVAPFNVNYRYAADELVYLLKDAQPAAIMYHARFASTLTRALEHFPAPRLIHVDDGSDNAPVPGAVRYEELLAASSPDPLELHPSPDDLHLLYTGGTTGMPKGVLWRQHDIFVNAMGGRSFDTGEVLTGIDEVVERSRVGGPPWLAVAPLMHGSAQWSGFLCLCAGRPFVMPAPTGSFDADLAWRTASREGVGTISIVGDAFGRPMLDALESERYELPELTLLINGGAALSVGVRERLLSALPTLTILDYSGSSESGTTLTQTSRTDEMGTGRFALIPGAVVLDDAMASVLSPTDDRIGWLAQRGNLPLGYLGDPGKTASTFPFIDGVRYSVPGDRARWHADGTIQFLGRDSVTINSGGEKIFAEEVEAAVRRHRDVHDVIVVGRPSSRWGNEVVALVQLAAGAPRDPRGILAEAARHIARYKLPKQVIFVNNLQRSPAGKPDYRWAKRQLDVFTTTPGGR